MRSKMKEWALLDFRKETKAVQVKYENMWHVCYSSDFKKFKIRNPGNLKWEEYSLVGDTTLSTPGRTPIKF